MRTFDVKREGSSGQGCEFDDKTAVVRWRHDDDARPPVTMIYENVAAIQRSRGIITWRRSASHG